MRKGGGNERRKGEKKEERKDGKEVNLKKFEQWKKHKNTEEGKRLRNISEWKGKDFVSKPKTFFLNGQKLKT